MSQQYESEYHRKSQEPFSVGVLGDGGWLHTVAAGLLRIDMVQDRRFGSIDISRTKFDFHPIFSEEVSGISALNVSGSRFQIYSSLYFSDAYINGGALGYIPDSKVTIIRDVIQNLLPDLQVRFRKTLLDTNEISIEKVGSIVSAELGKPSLGAKVAFEIELEEIRKERSHPEGIYYTICQEVGAEAMGLLGKQTKEDREWEEVLRGMFKGILASSDPIDDGTHKLITIQLRGVPDPDDELCDSWFGIPLTTPDRVKDVLEFYASGYASIVNAFCEVEGVQPPKPRVLLGSVIIS